MSTTDTAGVKAMSEAVSTDSINNRKRFREIISILRRHNAARNFSPEKLRAVLEDLGPTFIKLGQIISLRSDIIPENYCAELAKLRTEVAPMDFEDVRSVIEGSCGSRLEELFTSFAETPIGSASIAQVHLAKLKDGSRVVVKVQRIGIHDTMSRDIALLRRASGLLKIAGGTGSVIDFNMVINELWNTAQEEMNFLVEARNAEEFYELNRDVVFASCPRIYTNFTTEKVLVMENIEGISISDKEQLVENGYDLEEIGRKLADNYMKQIIDDGFFHADPHPGNIIIREGKIVWIDMGMMGRLPLRDQRLLGTAIEAVARHDIGTIKDVVLTIGVFRGKGKINHIRLYADIDDIMSKYGTLDLSEMNLSAVISDVLGIAKEHEISMPRGFSMLARGIATIEGVVADLSPAVNLIEITAARVSGNYLHNIDVKKEMTEISRKTLESGRKSLDIPALASDLLKMSIKGQTKINMEIQGSEDMNRIINRTVDRLVTGLLAAALLIGSSIVCTTDMEPKLLGIPALGVLGYTAAVILSVRLLIDMIANLLKRRF